MADVLLTHSYFLRFDPKELRAMMPYPPLAPLYACAMLRRTGFSVALHDVMFRQSENEIVEAIREHRSKVVIVYDDCFNYLTKMCLSRMRQAAFSLAQFAKKEGCTVVVFSSDASDHAKMYFDQGVDYVVLGEAEDTIVELCRFLLGKDAKPLKAVGGLAFREGDSVIHTPTRDIMKNLDGLPLPAWDLVDLESYRSRWMHRHGYFSMNIVTTRGCPFHCNWCAKPIYGQVYHSRSPENVVEEILHLKSVARPDHIWFADDIFGLKPGWIQKYDEVVNREQSAIPFKCLSRVDLLLKDDTIRHLRSAGCRSVWVGAESGSQKILDAMEKGTTVEQIGVATSLLHEHGIKVGFFLQFGYPGETKEDIGRTFEMVHNFRPDEIGVSISYPLPGTPFYERVKEEMESKQNWVDSQDLDLMFAGTFAPDYYRSLYRLIHKQFRVWRGVNSIRGLLRPRRHPPRKTIRSLLSMAYHAATIPIARRNLQLLENARESA